MKCYTCVKANVCTYFENILTLNNTHVKIKEIECNFYKPQVDLISDVEVKK